MFCNNIVKFESITQHILVINIKIENYGDMFRFTKPSTGQIQNTVLVHSVTVFCKCTNTVFCIWPDDGSVNRNMSP